MDEKAQLESELKSLRCDIAKLEDSIEPLRIRVQTVRVRLQELRTGLQMGQRITYRGTTGILEKFECYWPVIRPYTKSGKLACRTLSCYDYYADNQIKVDRYE